MNYDTNIDNRTGSKKLLKSTFLLSLLISFTVFAQEPAKPKQIQLSGNINLTNNGFSFVPLFSLGKPATTINLSVSGKRFSFDPQFRFDLDGMRPWSILFIMHYKLIQKEKLQVRLGSYFPAYAFTNLDYSRNDRAVEILTPQRYFIWTTNLKYSLSKKVNVSLFYLNARGLEKVDQIDRGNFISFRMGITNIKLSPLLSFQFNPEFYYLKVGADQGFYAAHTLALKHKKFPVYISSTINKAIDSDINAKDFDWNIAINYFFKNNYLKIRRKS